MKWATIKAGVVDTVYLRQQDAPEGAVQIPNDVFAGFVRDGDRYAPPPREPDAEPTPSEVAVLREALKDKGAVTDADLAAAEERLKQQRDSKET